MVHEESKKIDRFSWGIIRRKVRQLVGRAGFTTQDREDLQQELLARLLERLPSFDPSQGHRNKFVTTVIERTVANILRDKRAEKRDYRRISSLNVLVEVDEDGPTELAESIGQREYDARRDRHPRTDEELAQLASDVADVLESLPHDLRGLAERLKTQSLSQAARDLGVPRSTLQETVRKLRARFEDAGLRDYV